MGPMIKELVKVKADKVYLDGILEVPENAIGLVLFAHGADSNRLSPRNDYVAKQLRNAQIGTLLIDLLTKEENQLYTTRFNIPLMTMRLNAICNWVETHPSIANLPLGLYGSSTGGAAALEVAAKHSKGIAAVVSRGGRPDLASQQTLLSIVSPTLLIVGGHDGSVLDMNQRAFAVLKNKKKLEIISGATHLFEEPGALEKVAELSSAWFRRHMIRHG